MSTFINFKEDFTMLNYLAGGALVVGGLLLILGSWRRVTRWVGIAVAAIFIDQGFSKERKEMEKK